MEIGKPRKTITITPLSEPVGRPKPAEPKPVRAPAPAREPVKVPAR